MYPNMTVKWAYKTEAWVHGCPTIAPDGTIYCGSDDGYLYAFHRNGTLLWKTYTGSGMWASPSLDKEGNLYFGMWHSKIMSVAPNGSVRWTFPLPEGDMVWGSTAAISDDGTVYIGNYIDHGTTNGGELIALGLDGSLKWRKVISDYMLYSSPVIGSNGAIYICSLLRDDDLCGLLHCFGSGTPRTVELTKPRPNSLYVFGLWLGPFFSPLGRSLVLGRVMVQAEVSCESMLEKVCFYIDDELKGEDAEAPYAWAMDARYGDRAWYSHRIKVEARFVGGCTWTDAQNVIYLHLRRN
jgi:hypothetical protein